MTQLMMFLGTVLLALLVSLLFALPVMWCWDVVMPALFKLPEITYWQAWLLLILCNFLFKPSSVEWDSE